MSREDCHSAEGEATDDHDSCSVFGGSDSVGVSLIVIDAPHGTSGPWALNWHVMNSP